MEAFSVLDIVEKLVVGIYFVILCPFGQINLSTFGICHILCNFNYRHRRQICKKRIACFYGIEIRPENSQYGLAECFCRFTNSLNAITVVSRKPVVAFIIRVIPDDYCTASAASVKRFKGTIVKTIIFIKVNISITLIKNSAVIIQC